MFSFFKKPKAINLGTTFRIHRNNLQDLMMDCRAEMVVTFTKKDGSLKTLKGLVEPHKNHPGVNPTAHLGKYVLLTENWSSNTPKFRNVNLHTVEHVCIGMDTYIVDGLLTGK